MPTQCLLRPVSGRRHSGAGPREDTEERARFPVNSTDHSLFICPPAAHHLMLPTIPPPHPTHLNFKDIATQAVYTYSSGLSDNAFPNAVISVSADTWPELSSGTLRRRSCQDILKLYCWCCTVRVSHHFSRRSSYTSRQLSRHDRSLIDHQIGQQARLAGPRHLSH